MQNSDWLPHWELITLGSKVRLLLRSDANPVDDVSGWSFYSNSKWETGEIVEVIPPDTRDGAKKNYPTYNVKDKSGKLWVNCYYPIGECPFPNPEPGPSSSFYHGDIWPLPLLDALADE